MKRQWEDCPRDEASGRWAGANVSMNPKGEIMITRRTFEMLGAPAAFQLRYDRFNTTIGLQPCDSKVSGAYPAGPHGGFGGRVIRAFPLCKKFGITLDHSVRFLLPQIDEDGILVLDLRNTAPVLRRDRKRKTARVS